MSARALGCGMAVLALAQGCGGPALDVPPWAQVGTGDVGFEPVTEGQEVGIQSGIQGGQHIWGSVRATGLDWRDASVEFVLLDEEGLEAEEPTRLRTSMQQCPQDQDGCDQGMGELVGATVLVNNPGGIRGDRITMQVTVTDDEGRSATDARVVFPRWQAE